MSQTTRRGFFETLAALMAGAVAAMTGKPSITPTTLGAWDYSQPVPPLVVRNSELQFHKDAFAMVWPAEHPQIMRLDVLYGSAPISPNYAERWNA